MALNITNTPGDGTFTATVALPDSGNTINVSGAIWPGTPNETAFSGSPLTAPGAPGSGVQYWAIEVNLGTASAPGTGVLTMLTSTVAMPTADPSCEIIFQQQLTPGQTDDALNSTDVTPDQ